LINKERTIRDPALIDKGDEYEYHIVKPSLSGDTVELKNIIADDPPVFSISISRVTWSPPMTSRVTDNSDMLIEDDAHSADNVKTSNRTTTVAIVIIVDLFMLTTVFQLTGLCDLREINHAKLTVSKEKDAVIVDLTDVSAQGEIIFFSDLYLLVQKIT
jgi:hypothetical protein